MARSKTEIRGFAPMGSFQLGWAVARNFAINGRQISSPAAYASITVGSENTNVRTVNITLRDVAGDALDYVETFEIIMYASSAMTALSSGGSTGLAIGTNGTLDAIIAKKYFLATCEADGTWDGTWTDTGTAAFNLGVRLSNGVITLSGDYANT